MEPIEYEFDGVNYQLEPIGSDDLSNHDLHVKRVYSDPDFISELSEFEKVYSESIKKAIDRTRSTRSDEVYSYFEQLAKDWRITKSEVALAYNNAHFDGKRLVREPSEQPMLIDWNSLLNEERFTVEFNLKKVKKGHLEDLWKQIEQRQLKMNGGKLKRNRAPENTPLIYAMFKARKNGYTFPEVHKQYESGTLRGYAGSTSQYVDSDSLERHYRKYQP